MSFSRALESQYCLKLRYTPQRSHSVRLNEGEDTRTNIFRNYEVRCSDAKVQMKRKHGAFPSVVVYVIAGLLLSSCAPARSDSTAECPGGHDFACFCERGRLTCSDGFMVDDDPSCVGAPDFSSPLQNPDTVLPACYWGTLTVSPTSTETSTPTPAPTPTPTPTPAPSDPIAICEDHVYFCSCREEGILCFIDGRAILVAFDPSCEGQPDGVLPVPHPESFLPVCYWGTPTATPTATPGSEADCPPGTYFAPVTNRCILIAISTPREGGGGCGQFTSEVACQANGCDWYGTTGPCQ